MDQKSRWKIFTEDVLRIRVKPNQDKQDEIPVVRRGRGLVDLIDDLDSGEMINLAEFEKFRTLAEDRENQYKVFDEMKADSIISAALELYADDATQYNRDGSIIWAKSEDTTIAAFANRLIDILGLNTNAWSHIYMLCLYGDVYLETFTDEEIDESDPLMQGFNEPDKTIGTLNIKKSNKPGYQMREYIEAVNNPAEIFDLVKYGKTIGFAKVPSKDQDTGRSQIFKAQNEDINETLYSPSKYVHVCLNQDVDRYPETISISFKGQKKVNGKYIKSKNSDDIVQIDYTVKRGKSVLYNVFKIYQELKLMEDAILLNRITRSSIIRLMQVEVGDMTKSQVSNILKRLKQMMEQRNMIDKDQGRFRSQASPGPIDNIIYVPTRNGKGQVSMSNVGGDVDIKSIADIDYFNNKLFGGLKIPKQFLGFTDDAAGFSGGTSLTKLDSRYARTIKRIQNAYISAVTTLINLFAIDKGLNDYVNKFTINMVSPSTTEDSERDENMDSKMSIISSFIELLGDSYTPQTKKEVLEYFISTYFDDAELTKILEKDKDVPSSDEEGEGGEPGTPDVEMPDNDIDIDLGSDAGDESFSEPPEDFGTEEPADFGSSDDEGFGDFENEFNG